MGSSCCTLCDTQTEDRTPLDRGASTARPRRERRSASRNTRSRQPSVHTISHPRTPSNSAPQQGARSASRVFFPTASPLQAQTDNTEQIKSARAQGIIEQIPSGLYKPGKHCAECAICIIDFEAGDEIKYLPCMHIYHKDCIDDWLSRNLRCPSCMEPVDAALLSSFDTFASF